MKQIGFLFFLSLILIAVSGCAPATPTPIVIIAQDQNYEKMIEVGSEERTYYVHLPSTVKPSEPWPVLLFFHGWHYPPEPMREETKTDDVADERGFVAVYPLGYRETWQPDQFDSLSQRTDDIEFVNAIIDEILNDIPIDPARIYAVGFSMGGLFSNRLACELSDRIAAFGGVAGPMTDALHYQPEPCDPPAPIPFVYIHGTEDDRVGFDDVLDSVDFWVGVNGCSDSPALSDIPDISDDGTQITKTVYGDCQQGAEVVLYTIEGGGHTWPGNLDYAEVALEIGVGRVSGDIHGSTVLWEFVSQFSLPE